MKQLKSYSRITINEEKNIIWWCLIFRYSNLDINNYKNHNINVFILVRSLLNTTNLAGYPSFINPIYF
jgi:hypothetical protein